MPVIRVSLVAGRSAEQKAKAAAALTAALREHFGCHPDDVMIIFEEQPGENWAVSGQLLSERRPAAKSS